MEKRTDKRLDDDANQNLRSRVDYSVGGRVSFNAHTLNTTYNGVTARQP